MEALKKASEADAHNMIIPTQIISSSDEKGKRMPDLAYSDLPISEINSYRCISHEYQMDVPISLIERYAVTNYGRLMHLIPIKMMPEKKGKKKKGRKRSRKTKRKETDWINVVWGWRQVNPRKMKNPKAQELRGDSEYKINVDKGKVEYMTMWQIYASIADYKDTYPDGFYLARRDFAIDPEHFYSLDDVAVYTSMEQIEQRIADIKDGKQVDELPKYKRKTPLNRVTEVGFSASMTCLNFLHRAKCGRTGLSAEFESPENVRNFFDAHFYRYRFIDENGNLTQSRMCFDTDIKTLGKYKIYSAETTLYVPQAYNSFFSWSEIAKGYRIKYKDGKYIVPAKLSWGSRQRAEFDTHDEALKYARDNNADVIISHLEAEKDRSEELGRLPDYVQEYIRKGADAIRDGTFGYQNQDLINAYLYGTRDEIKAVEADLREINESPNIKENCYLIYRMGNELKKVLPEIDGVELCDWKLYSINWIFNQKTLHFKSEAEIYEDLAKKYRDDLANRMKGKDGNVC